MGGGARPVRDRWPWLTQLAILIGVLLFYFALPTEGDLVPGRLVISLLLCLLGIGLIVVTIAKEFQREVSGTASRLKGGHVLVLFELGLLAFALAYFIVDRQQPDQLVGLETKLDSLYFAATTMTTVGFGDIHAAGQLARGLVLLQLVFDVVIIALIARIMNHRLDARTRRDGMPGI